MCAECTLISQSEGLISGAGITARPAKSEFFANISLTIGFIKILSIPYEVQLLIPQLYAL